MSHGQQFPDDAYAPDGTLWWELTMRPATKQAFGQTGRLAAWLWFTKDIGATFTLPEARAALGSGLAQSQHFDRRLRELREAGWMIPSGRDVGEGLRNDEYRLDGRGTRLWIDEEREKLERFAPSAKVRRKVFERDGQRCVICGVATRESYPNEPATSARLTIGHRVPQERLRQYGQRDNIDNWRTECARCNETVRDAAPDPRTFEELLPQVKALTKQEKAVLLDWLLRGERVRSELDRVFDEVRMLSENERERMLDRLKGFAN